MLRKAKEEKEKGYMKLSYLGGFDFEQKTLKPMQFSAIGCDDGLLLCCKEKGSFLKLRFNEDLENLIEFLQKIEIIK